MTAPNAVACSRPNEPPKLSGLPVIKFGAFTLFITLYSSIFQDIVCASVYTSVVVMSFVRQTLIQIALNYTTDKRSTSVLLISLGSHWMASLPPPYDKLKMPHFNVIHIDKALTSFSSTSEWKRIPPFVGPTESLC